MVTAFRFKYYFCPLTIIKHGPIISTQIFPRGISSASLDGNLPYFIFDRFVHWQVSPIFTYFWTVFLMIGNYKCWKIISSILSIPV